MNRGCSARHRPGVEDADLDQRRAGRALHCGPETHPAWVVRVVRVSRHEFETQFDGLGFSKLGALTLFGWEDSLT